MEGSGNCASLHPANPKGGRVGRHHLQPATRPQPRARCAPSRAPRRWCGLNAAGVSKCPLAGFRHPLIADGCLRARRVAAPGAAWDCSRRCRYNDRRARTPRHYGSVDVFLEAFDAARRIAAGETLRAQNRSMSTCPAAPTILRTRSANTCGRSAEQSRNDHAARTVSRSGDADSARTSLPSRESSAVFAHTLSGKKEIRWITTTSATTTSTVS